MERVKRRSETPIGHELIQLPLFPESASMSGIRPELNERRYYRLVICPDLFGGPLLMRDWGRINTAGQQRLDVHSEAGGAVTLDLCCHCVTVRLRDRRRTGIGALRHNDSLAAARKVGKAR